MSENALESHVAAEDLQVRVTDPGPQYLDERLPGRSSRDPRSRVQHRPALRARPQRQHPSQRRSNLEFKRLRVLLHRAKARNDMLKEIFAFAYDCS